jgi:hypothetical protein
MSGLAPGQKLPILEADPGGTQAVSIRVLEVMNPDGPESSQGMEHRAPRRISPPRPRAAFHPELFIRGCGCPS